MTPIDRLSITDVAMLEPDRLGWPQDIGAIAILEGAPFTGHDGTFRFEKCRAVIEERLHLVPRLRQILIEPPAGLGLPFWTDATGFDVDDHVRVTTRERPIDDTELLAIFEELRARRFARHRPLWEMWFVPGLTGNRVALLVKIHHTVADGMSGIATFGAFLDMTRERGAVARVPWTPRAEPSRVMLLLDNLRRRLHEVIRPLVTLVRPRRLVACVRRLAPMLREIRQAPIPATSLARAIGPHRRFRLLRTSLATVKAIARRHHAKVNDVLIAAIASGLRDLFRHRGERIDRPLRIFIPIAVGSPNTAGGNRTSGMLVPLSVEAMDDRERLRAIAADTAIRKRQPRPQVGAVSFPGARMLLRWLLRRQPKQRMMSIYAANVAGPPMPLYFAGAKLLEIFPIVPLGANTPLSVGALSYAGQFAITIVADADACPDMEVFAVGVQQSLARLADASIVEAHRPSRVRTVVRFNERA